jgi:sulfite reductase beta subunit-like hemoprotein
MIRAVWRHALLPLLLFAAGNAALATGNYPGNAARVNGVDVSYQRFMGLYKEHQRDKGVVIAARGDQLPLLTQIRKEAMDMLIEQELIVQAAAAQGVEVSAEQIDAAWADLDEPQGSATGLCVRSVKICPGTDCCKRGLQDSIGVGLEIDRRFHGKQLPWKFKIGVSGCPNDCGETCINDIGLIGTPRGWHLSVGGNGGSQPRLSQRLLEHIPDDQQALAAVDRLIDWFTGVDRKCRFGKLLEEFDLETLRQIALGQSGD